MTDILDKIVGHPATAYLIGFGGLSVLLNMALRGAKNYFSLHDQTLGITVVAAGALGGLCLQGGGLVSLPGGSLLVRLAIAAFVGVASSFAAAGFSDVDLRNIVKKKEPTP